MFFLHKDYYFLPVFEFFFRRQSKILKFCFVHYIKLFCLKMIPYSCPMNHEFHETTLPPLSTPYIQKQKQIDHTLHRLALGIDTIDVYS